ncbi:MAG: saccharopine dehydrogenase [Gemmatimonadales bacterium]|nr:MAG: saccharopine dehydrogenase [Gemmatimonadales bacterium]
MPHMKLLVLGAGLQGNACAYNLLQHRSVARVTLADAVSGTLPAFLTPGDDRLRVETADAADTIGILDLMRGHDAVLCALPYYFNEPMTRLAIEANCHFADLGGNTEIVFQQKEHHQAAVAKGLSVIPDCGIAPGMVNILAAEGLRRLETTDAVRIYVGGLPQDPEPPLNYQIVYSLEGALDYYTTPSWILREGKTTQVEALSELETLSFPDPIGELEAFHTGGGISTMPFAWENKVSTMEYKTLRYPGHMTIMRSIRELGLISNDPIEVKGVPVVPRDVFIAAVQPKLFRPEGRDLVALRVLATGTRDGKPATVSFQLVDHFDQATGISAMMRTTGFSLALIGLMQMGGSVTAKGVRTPDEAVPFSPYIEGLAEFGVRIEEQEA